MLEYIEKMIQFAEDIVPYGFRVDIGADLGKEHVTNTYLRKEGLPDIVDNVTILSGEFVGEYGPKTAEEVIERFSKFIPDFKFDKKMKFYEKCSNLV